MPSSSQAAPLALGRDPREESTREGKGEREGGPRKSSVCARIGLWRGVWGLGRVGCGYDVGCETQILRQKCLFLTKKLRKRGRNVHRQMMLDSAWNLRFLLQPRSKYF